MIAPGSRVGVQQSERAALISECGLFRYWLTRSWRKPNQRETRLLFVMLNPSIADANQDDPTIRKCIGFAKRIGFNTIAVVNLFAYRATDPTDLKAASKVRDVVGPLNDRHITHEISLAQTVVAAWGAHTIDESYKRILFVDRQVLAREKKLQCLGVTKWGAPRHPLMVSYVTKLEEWKTRHVA